MQQQRRRSGIMIGLMALGLLAGVALTAGPAQAQVAGPYYANPAWAQQLPVATRFVVLTNWGSNAVLDKETGLVWEKSPQAAPATWNDARVACANKPVGNRKGWRLPSLHELQSLIQPSGFTAGGPALPPGHPFLTVKSADYWSASTVAGNPLLSWGVFFGNGNVGGEDKAVALHAWCVRGGMNADQH